MISRDRKQYRRTVRRPLVVMGDIAIVQLTKGAKSIIDAADAPLVAGHNWTLWPSGSGRLYAGRQEGKKTIRLHQVILPPKAGFLIDHADDNGLNNRRSNLRYATARENQRNRKNFKKKGYRGVYYNKSRDKFCAVLYLGEFDSAQEAWLEYNRALNLVYPDFGRPENEITPHSAFGRAGQGQ
jgi:hypothetical protein